MKAYIIVAADGGPYKAKKGNYRLYRLQFAKIDRTMA